MNIGVIGINHNLAPINIREHVSFTDIQKIEAINYFLDRYRRGSNTFYL